MGGFWIEDHFDSILKIFCGESWVRRVESERLDEVVQGIKSVDGIDHWDTSGSGKKWWDFGYSLKARPTGSVGTNIFEKMRRFFFVVTFLKINSIFNLSFATCIDLSKFLSFGGTP